MLQEYDQDCGYLVLLLAATAAGDGDDDDDGCLTRP